MKKLIVLLVMVGTGWGQTRDSMEYYQRPTDSLSAFGKLATGLEQPFHPIPTITWTKNVNLDSLTARIEGLEKEDHILLICLLMGIFYSTILFLMGILIVWRDHTSKKWTEVHK